MDRVGDPGGEVRCWPRKVELDELEAVALEADWQREIDTWEIRYENPISESEPFEFDRFRGAVIIRPNPVY